MFNLDSGQEGQICQVKAVATTFSTPRNSPSRSPPTLDWSHFYGERDNSWRQLSRESCDFGVMVSATVDVVVAFNSQSRNPDNPATPDGRHTHRNPQLRAARLNVYILTVVSSSRLCEGPAQSQARLIVPSSASRPQPVSFIAQRNAVCFRPVPQASTVNLKTVTKKKRLSPKILNGSACLYDEFRTVKVGVVLCREMQSPLMLSKTYGRSRIQYVQGRRTLRATARTNTKNQECGRNETGVGERRSSREWLKRSVLDDKLPKSWLHQTDSQLTAHSLLLASAFHLFDYKKASGSSLTLPPEDGCWLGAFHLTKIRIPAKDEGLTAHVYQRRDTRHILKWPAKLAFYL
ncbi:hypothetical protein CC1G_08847 [Coprinopsis cinerea okayama7|uniref:Uncharacterized protein n=1 Tax=Coprinopsis cinerea (strain Okayama-7 / 130 / ATCC MYA-4618 / FGSC 9003) TaxID=240176 RepID=A8P6B6_COPC7|nr:hypothetical protein CC1G_08847 [Coprinopsis cinerea okayama7\|eukprot:XP_001839121.2 hypothetical protein CC1G_08847 [Coprinopsis cinerea okayama7\